ncbi:MAG TPA: hypothetical protein VFC31_03415 [Candidatus Limnocylindria bacterium]|nr:hypothetical protein [Candidatus Limnocylindria bacterium]
MVVAGATLVACTGGSTAVEAAGTLFTSGKGASDGAAGSGGSRGGTTGVGSGSATARSPRARRTRPTRTPIRRSCRRRRRDEGSSRAPSCSLLVVVVRFTAHGCRRGPGLRGEGLGLLDARGGLRELLLQLGVRGPETIDVALRGREQIAVGGVARLELRVRGIELCERRLELGAVGGRVGRRLVDGGVGDDRPRRLLPFGRVRGARRVRRAGDERAQDECRERRGEPRSPGVASPRPPRTQTPARAPSVM